MSVTPAPANPFERVRVTALRAAQLMRGCIPRVPSAHRAVVTARLEVAAGKVQALPRPDAVAGGGAGGLDDGTS